MSAALDNKPEARKLYIGEGVTIKGATLVSDTVVVHGVLEGDISAGNLLVSATGVIRGRISVAQNAEIFGKVFERIDVRGLLVLRASSRVEGNVSCGILTIEQGANITGGISSTDYRTAQQSSTADRERDVRSSYATSTLKRFDFSSLELMPGPIGAGA